jgi:hypothetical protein
MATMKRTAQSGSPGGEAHAIARETQALACAHVGAQRGLFRVERSAFLALTRGVFRAETPSALRHRADLV